jgi:glycerol-3-phosphate dehydrogenase
MNTLRQPLATDRSQLVRRLGETRSYDLAVIGGGATGLGVALDAAARGLSVVLVDSHDFAKGTSSRSTKLVHGGVRYLAQGNISLVQEALHERSLMLHNAPYLAQPLPFIMPSYRWWEVPFYGAGLKMYDALAGRAGLGSTELLSRAEALKQLPNLRPTGLKGGVKYWDGQFNDARFALALARTAAQHGALLVNYCRANEFTYEANKISGLICEDTLTGLTYPIRARCVVNATGVWVDELRHKDGLAVPSASGRQTQAMVAPSQGVHMVVDREFLNSDAALMVPKTADGRVLFAVPWLGKIILGTTDTPRHDLALEPRPFDEEIDFILTESARYLSRAPHRSNVKSIWVGLRPLVKPPQDEGDNTKGLSREHTIVVSRSGLVTVTGGKWTTYRAMAEDVLEKCEDGGLITKSRAGQTKSMPLVGVGSQSDQVRSIHEAPGLHSYGCEADIVKSLPGAQDELCPGLTQAMVRFAARYEYAMTVEDVLARRSRLLFLDAAMAANLAERVGEILNEEGVRATKVEEFRAMSAQYLLPA